MIIHPRGIEWPVLRPLCWMLGHKVVTVGSARANWTRCVCLRCGGYAPKAKEATD